jgi:hypothetical protein
VTSRRASAIIAAVLLFGDKFWRVELYAPQIVRVARTPEPFTRADEARDSYAGLWQTVQAQPLDRGRHGLLVDLRDGPQRSDPAFEEAVRDHRARVFDGFCAGAVLVRTLGGKLQLGRLEREDRAYRAFDDEAEALAALRDALDNR